MLKNEDAKATDRSVRLESWSSWFQGGPGNWRVAGRTMIPLHGSRFSLQLKAEILHPKTHPISLAAHTLH